ncbi:MAG: DUF885 domain-containing protein [Chitinophagales bacterium]|nr:DUF885 domain-containing protein [Chitinophagales bacterium]
MKKNTLNIIMALLMPLAVSPACAQEKSDEMFGQFSKRFVKGYEGLEVLPLQMSYVGNLNGIKTKAEVTAQEDFFSAIQDDLAQFDPNKLTKQEWLDYQIIKYETNLNLERISLEKDWISRKASDPDDSGIFHQTNGKEWYAHFLKRWINDSATPDEMFRFGLSEIDKVKTAMQKLQEKSGLSPDEFQHKLKEASFFIHTKDSIQEAYEALRITVNQKASSYFPYVDEIVKVKIVKSTNENLKQVPAYYNEGTFFYNYFDEPYNTRQLGWIFLHEAVPGHHYQLMLTEKMQRSDVQDLFFYLGYVEGWGAYIEQYGKELGAYTTLYDEYGKWEWDLIRSVRVALDVGINYYGWDDEKAMQFWQEHIKDQDKIAEREIARMRRWPAQVITYKYGTDVLNELRGEITDSKSLKEYHTKVLINGDVPLSILKEIITS